MPDHIPFISIIVDDLSSNPLPEGVVIWGVLSFILLLTILGVIGFQRSQEKVRIEERVMDFWGDCLRRIRERGIGRAAPSPRDMLLEAFTEWMRREERDGAGAPRAKSNEDISSRLKELEKERLKRGEELSLLEERLLLISGRTNRNNSMSFMPHISELRELSLQRMESNHWFKMLYMTTAIVLICGICGTLWSVHLELSDMTQLKMEALATSLFPSGIAVIANILLIVLRNILARELDCRLSELDDLTLTLFTPALQPKSRIGQVLDNFKEKASFFSSDNTNSPFKVFCTAFCDSSRRILQATSMLQRTATMLRELFDSKITLYTKILEKLRELRDAQNQQQNKFRQWVEALIQTADLTRQIKREQETVTGNLQKLHQSNADCVIVPEEMYTAHRNACDSLRHALQDITNTLVQLKTWESSCARSKELCRDLLGKVDDRTKLIEDCSRAAEALAQKTPPLPKQLTHLAQQWHRTIIEHAGTTEQFSSISRAADTFEFKIQQEVDNKSQGMKEFARMATEHRDSLGETLNILLNSGTRFNRKSQKTSPWPLIYSCLIVLFIITLLSTLAYFLFTL